MMLKLGDHQLQMGHHRLRASRPSLSLPTCRALSAEFGTQRIVVVGDRIGGIHRNDEGITIARSRAREICRSSTIPKLSARHLRPPGSLRMSPVDPFQHIAQLRGGNCNDTVRRRWPDEPTVLQSLGVERHPQTVMPKNFQQVTAFSPENVEVTGMWIAEQRLLNLQRETVHATAHVSRTSRQPDANT